MSELMKKRKKELVELALDLRGDKNSLSLQRRELKEENEKLEKKVGDQEVRLSQLEEALTNARFSVETAIAVLTPLQDKLNGDMAQHNQFPPSDWEPLDTKELRWLKKLLNELDCRYIPTDMFGRGRY